MLRKIANVLTHNGQMNLLEDEAGFINFLLGGAQLAAPFLGRLFGGGAPQEQDLTQGLQDVGNLTRDALVQHQDLRGDLVQNAGILKDIATNNARSVGAFDPTSLGSQFGFLGDTVGQFQGPGIDRSANALRELMQNQQMIAQLAGQVGGQAPSLQLGINQLLANAGQQAGGGLGGAIGNTLSTLGNQQMMGTGVFSGQQPGLLGLLSGLGGGQQGGAVGMSPLIQAIISSGLGR